MSDSNLWQKIPAEFTERFDMHRATTPPFIRTMLKHIFYFATRSQTCVFFIIIFFPPLNSFRLKYGEATMVLKLFIHVSWKTLSPPPLFSPTKLMRKMLLAWLSTKLSYSSVMTQWIFSLFLWWHSMKTAFSQPTGRLCGSSVEKLSIGIKLDLPKSCLKWPCGQSLWIKPVCRAHFTSPGFFGIMSSIILLHFLNNIAALWISSPIWLLVRVD